jgi:hypothetical protein
MELVGWFVFVTVHCLAAWSPNVKLSNNNVCAICYFPLLTDTTDCAHCRPTRHETSSVLTYGICHETGSVLTCGTRHDTGSVLTYGTRHDTGSVLVCTLAAVHSTASLMKQQFVETHRYKTSCPILTDQHLSTFCFYGNIRSSFLFLGGGHSILTEGVFVTELSGNGGS